MDHESYLEVEWKFVSTNFDALRERLVTSGAKKINLVFERNTVLDSLDRRLFQKGWLLRVRCSDKVVLTLKRPVQVPADNTFKIMQEDEVCLQDDKALLTILNALGFSTAFTYEKLRETWRLGETLICLDELPFGTFVELEGTQQSLPLVAGLLGFDLSCALNSTYKDLHREYLARQGLPDTPSFVFPAEIAEQFMQRCRREEICTPSTSGS